MVHAFVLNKLKKSRFRSSFHLEEKEKGIVEEKGIGVIREHARELLRQRIGSLGDNDGRQTPWKGHPVFVGQHATATCCRKCLWKWHGVPIARQLDESEIDYFADLICEWIGEEMKKE